MDGNILNRIMDIEDISYVILYIRDFLCYSIHKRFHMLFYAEEISYVILCRRDFIYYFI